MVTGQPSEVEEEIGYNVVHGIKWFLSRAGHTPFAGGDSAVMFGPAPSFGVAGFEHLLADVNERLQERGGEGGREEGRGGGREGEGGSTMRRERRE